MLALLLAGAMLASTLSVPYEGCPTADVDGDVLINGSDLTKYGWCVIPSGITITGSINHTCGALEVGATVEGGLSSQRDTASCGQDYFGLHLFGNVQKDVNVVGTGGSGTQFMTFGARSGDQLSIGGSLTVQNVDSFEVRFLTELGLPANGAQLSIGSKLTVDNAGYAEIQAGDGAPVFVGGQLKVSNGSGISLQGSVQIAGMVTLTDLEGFEVDGEVGTVSFGKKVKAVNVEYVWVQGPVQINGTRLSLTTVKDAYITGVVDVGSVGVVINDVVERAKLDSVDLGLKPVSITGAAGSAPKCSVTQSSGPKVVTIEGCADTIVTGNRVVRSIFVDSTDSASVTDNRGLESIDVGASTNKVEIARNNARNSQSTVTCDGVEPADVESCENKGFMGNSISG